ncbi:hypothetical protein [Nonomuraea sp. NPDC049695]|uniref:hypothetical protein n=1 Tax=Nonomuraea sp. NPDC049695 TaxID=3154734 RepID=UPI0034403D98
MLFLHHGTVWPRPGTSRFSNPVAAAMVERAEALLDGDQEALLATADAFDAWASSKPSARTIVLGDAAFGDR